MKRCNVNLAAFAVQLAAVLAGAHARLDRAGIPPAAPHPSWTEWRTRLLEDK